MPTTSPQPEKIKEARANAKLTQTQAAGLVLAKSYRTWQGWESGSRAMPACAWELFLLKIDKHPDFILEKRQ